MSAITLQTPIVNLSNLGVAKLSGAAARKLALAVAAIAGKTDAGEAAVEDLLNYLPMRWEDRSALTRIGELVS